MQLYKKLKSLGRRVLRLGEAQEGLAIVYSMPGRLMQVEAVHKSAAEIFEKVAGLNSLEAWGAWNNLSLLYRAEGKYAEAEPLFRKKVEDAVDQGKSALAEPLYRQAIAMWEKPKDLSTRMQPACCFAWLKFAGAKQEMLRPSPSISRSSQFMTNMP